MRRLAIIGAVVLTLATATSVFAASNSDVWRAHAAASGMTSGSTITMTVDGKRGSVAYVANHAKTGTTVNARIVVAACGKSGVTWFTFSPAKTGATGTDRAYHSLTARQLAALKAATAKKETLSFRIAAGKTSTCGNFAPVK